MVASPRWTASVTAGAVLLAFQVVVASSARAEENPSPPPATEVVAAAPVEVDSSDPDLKLPEGAALAAPKVLDIKSVVEDESGDERREDTNTEVTFALQAEVLFGKDSARLGDETKSRIAGIADEIRAQGASRVRIFGFTDNLGSSAHGDLLSKRRADAVQQVLAAELDDSDITYEVRGYGEQYPIADNSTETGRKKNRRVEVSFPRTENPQESRSEG
ncbi:OmpA family protein [Streptomyces sp. HSG2]|uniref:OmpA family protein n=1 Tax=Streptomyces sp. HSG2 TaxID=2797167 RepID=UPI00190400FC|nr:OmpA family protein [Streptomyces sp. HSG2]